MIKIKRLLARFNVYKLKVKKLESTIKTLWGVIDELGKILTVAVEMRQKEEQQRLKREERKPTTAIFYVKPTIYKERMQDLAITQRICDWGFLFTEAFKKISSYPERRFKKIFGVK